MEGAPPAWHSPSNCTTADGGIRHVEVALLVDVDASASPFVPGFEPFSISGASVAGLAVVQILLSFIQHGASGFSFAVRLVQASVKELVSGATYDVEEQCAHQFLLLLGIRTPLAKDILQVKNWQIAENPQQWRQ